jgi:hypothetical protein
MHCVETAAGVSQNLFLKFLCFNLAFFVYAAAATEAAYSQCVQPLAASDLDLLLASVDSRHCWRYQISRQRRQSA